MSFQTDGDVIRDLALRLGVISDMRGLESWDARVDRTKKGLQGAADYANKFSGELGKLRDMAIYAAAGLAGGFATLVGGTALLADQTSEYAVAVERQAGALGMTTDAYQEIRQTFERFGVDQRDVADLFAQISQQSLSAQSGAKNVAQAFTDLGVPLQKLKGADTLGILDAIADGASKTHDPVKRLASLSTLLGEDLTKKLSPLLSQGSAGIAQFRREVRESGAVLSGEAIADAERYRATMAGLKLTYEGIRNEIGAAFLPALTSIAEAVRDTVKANRQWISTQITTWVQRLARFTQLAGTGIRFAARHSYALAAALTAAAAAGGSLAAALAAFRVGSAIYYGLAGLASLFTAIGPAFSAMAGLSFEASTIAVLESFAATLVAFTGLSLGTIFGVFAVAVAAVISQFVIFAAMAASVAEALLSVYLIVEDLYLFLTGNSNTVLGEFVAGWAATDTTLGSVARTFLQLRTLAFALMDVIRDLVTLAGQSLDPVFQGIRDTFDSVSAAISNTVQSILNAVLAFNGVSFDGFTARIAPMIGMVRGFVADLDRLVQSGAGLGGILGTPTAQSAVFAGATALSGGNTSNNTYTDRSSTSVTVQTPDPLAAGRVVVGELQRARATGQIGLGGDR